MDNPHIRSLYILVIFNLLLTAFILFVLVTQTPILFSAADTDQPKPADLSSDTAADQYQDIEAVPVTVLESEDPNVENVVVKDENGQEIILRSDAIE